MTQYSDKIVITGAAGLVGQNLILMLREQGYRNLVAIDKKAKNLAILRRLNPGLDVVEADLSIPDTWSEAFRGAQSLVQLHAQIGGENSADFEANNVAATRHVMSACRAHGIRHIVHVSSSVIHSATVDFYTESKKEQESLVASSGIPYVILRPTLMFGWFDRKHLGWLSRFMKKSPVFPIPAEGRYVRQPLYVRDFCAIVLTCLARPSGNANYNITGMEEVDYINMITTIKAVIRSSTRIVHIPYRLFWWLLYIYAKFDRDPPFTTRQLEALIIPEKFEIIPWDTLFGVTPTPFQKAVVETFTHPDYSGIILEF